MSKKAVIGGQFVRFDVSGVRVTQSLLEALNILDGECRHGSGGLWDISREGRKVIATPADGPFDTLVFNSKKRTWDVL